MNYTRPADFHAALTDERLEAIAAVLYGVRLKVLDHLDRAEGDDARVFGYTAWVRCCSKFIEAEAHWSWFKVVGTGRGEHFILSVGGVPLRFYSGTPDSVSVRWVARDEPEKEAQQMAFQFMRDDRAADCVLRLVVKTTVADRRTDVALVRYSTSGDVLDQWSIRTPADVEREAILHLADTREGVEIPAPPVEDPNDAAGGVDTGTAANDD